MYYCGWDGGGTKTEICLLDEQGNQIALQSFGPLNPNGASRERVEETVRDCIQWMAGRPGGLDAFGGLVIGFAGVSNQQAAEMVSSAAAQNGYRGKLRLLGDQEIALAGAVDGPGAVLIAGTGAICFGKDREGRPFRTGGCGYLIDDEGSGYAIGRDILTAAVRCMDGRDGDTCLAPLALAALNASTISDIITWVYAPSTGKKEVAALAPLLLKAMEQNDQTAQAIARKAARELALLVTAAWKKTGMEEGELALTGSILTRYSAIREETIRRIGEALPKLSIHAPNGSASQGAARLALQFFR